MQGHRQTCLDAGMDDFLSKPIIVAELDEVLARWAPAPETVSRRPSLRHLQPSTCGTSSAATPRASPK